MEKIKMVQPKQSPEYTCLDDRRTELNSVMHSVIKEHDYQKEYIPLTNLNCSNKQPHLTLADTDSHHSIFADTNINQSDEDHLKTKLVNERNKVQQNIWNSRLLRNGANNQRWFDKLQDYRNRV